MPPRERRLEDFTTVGEPVEELRAQLLCEDHIGTYTTTFACVRRAGEWVNEGTDDTIVCHVVGWREILPLSKWPART
jgi:hypothetical protein